MAVLLCALTAMPVTATVSKQERKTAAAVDDQQSWALDFLEQLVNVNSGTHNLPGVTRVGALLRPQFESLGFTVVWKPMAAAGRAGHLIASHQGRFGAKRLLLIGHMDTVFEPDSPFQRFVRKGDFANGPGASDDKGGVVVMLAALRAMRTAGALRNANIEVVLTGDEEDAGTPLTAGFVIGGSTAKTVLVRAIGPGLRDALGVQGTLADPRLDLFNSNSVRIAANDNWGGDSQLTEAGTRVGAFALPNPASADAILLLTLTPGNYTAEVSAASGGGLAIVEVYEVP